MRSGTSVGSSSASAWTEISSPCALRSIISSTASRYSSRYFSGSKSADSDSISCLAILTSLALASVAESGSSSSFSGGTISSAKSIVLMPSTPPAIGRITVRLSFERITTRAIATLPASLIASSRRL